MQVRSFRTAEILRPRGRLSFFLIVLSFAAGMIYGVLLISRGGALSDTLGRLAGGYVLAQREQSLLESFRQCLQTAFLFLLIPYLLGYSAIGQPGALVLPFFKGLGLGAFLGNLYRAFGWEALGYSALVLVPSAVLELLALFIGCRESIRLSCLFFSGFCPMRRGESLEKPCGPVTGGVIRLYNMKFLILCFMAVLSAGTYALCVRLVSGFFQLGT